MTKLQALVVTAVYPTPDMDSGSLSITNLMRMLMRLGFEVSHIAVGDFKAPPAARKRLADIGVNTIQGSAWASPEAYLRADGGRFNLVVWSTYLAGVPLFTFARAQCPNAVFVFNAGDMHHLRLEREARISRDARKLHDAAEAHRDEMFLIANTAATIVVSSAERDYLGQAAPAANVVHIPLVRDIPGRANGYNERADVGFIGYFLHAPNPDAALLLANAIWPRVRSVLPGVRLKLIGAGWPRQLPPPKGDGVEMVGHVQDLGAAFESLRLTVAPLRFGAGAKGKVVSSLAHGVPCVVTPVAAEGMDLIDGVNVLIADRTDLFAEKVIALYSDEGLWNRMSDAGLEAVRHSHSFDHGLELVRAMLASIGLSPEAQARVAS